MRRPRRRLKRETRRCSRLSTRLPFRRAIPSPTALRIRRGCCFFSFVERPSPLRCRGRLFLSPGKPSSRIFVLATWAPVLAALLGPGYGAIPVRPLCLLRVVPQAAAGEISHHDVGILPC